MEACELEQTSGSLDQTVLDVEDRAEWRGEHRTMAGIFSIPDEMWERIEPLIPEHVNTHPLGGGRPRAPDRQAMDGIFYVLRRAVSGGRLTALGSATEARPIDASRPPGSRSGSPPTAPTATGATRRPRPPRPPLGGRTHPLLDQPLPRPLDPLVQEARQPPRPTEVLPLPDHLAADGRHALIEISPYPATVAEDPATAGDDAIPQISSSDSSGTPGGSSRQRKSRSCTRWR